MHSPKQLDLICVVSGILNKHPNSLMTYGYLGRKTGHCPDSKYLAIALGAIQEIDLGCKRPLRSARVVRKDKKRPGKGFWEYARTIGLETPKGFWREQCEEQGVTDFDTILI